jgi:predicted PhzF superfamily epimerase YddE/YHI9
MHKNTYLCFGTLPGTGNAALVVDGANCPAAERQALAAACGAGATVFIDGDVLDFYYPHARSVLCLHASVAAAAALFARQGHEAAIEVTTAQRGQALRLTRDGDAYFIGLARQEAPQVDVDLDVVRTLLGAPFSACAVASVGSPKLLVEVADVASLQALAPDLAGIQAWGQQHGVNGFYAYCRIGEGHYAGRNFNHLDPSNEDKATGVAAGALSVHLQRGIRLDQGGSCRIVTELAGCDVKVGGTAEQISG